MKVFYSASLNGLLDDDPLYKLIKAIPSHITGFDRITLTSYLEDDSDKKPKDVSNILSELRTADAFIGEMSIPSQTLGFEIAYANLHFIPCLYLYHQDYATTKPSILIADNPARKLWTKKYKTEDLEKVIGQFFNMVERQMETSRTSFMSTREIDEFLDKESDTRGVPKGELIRQALAEQVKEKRKP